MAHMRFSIVRRISASFSICIRSSTFTISCSLSFTPCVGINITYSSCRNMVWLFTKFRFFHIFLCDDYRSKINIFLSFSFCGSIHSDTVGLFIFACSPDYFMGVYCRYLYLNCLSAGCAGELLLSTYFNQVYDDNRWWMPQYPETERRVSLCTM